jgi:cytidine deaminase
MLCMTCDCPEKDAKALGPELFDADMTSLVDLANWNMHRFPWRPWQSNFRVYCLMICDDLAVPGRRVVIEGNNVESAYLGGSICSERAAISSPTFRSLKEPLIRKVVISTDSKECIAPGCLCREFMSSFSNAETEIIMTNADKTRIVSCFLTDLYSYPFAYGRLKRNHIEPFAQTLAQKVSMSGSADPMHVSLFARAISAAKTLDSDKRSGAGVHPVCLGAAMVFSDGKEMAAGMLKGLEYGTTLDPVAGLLIQALQYMDDVQRANASAHGVEGEGEGEGEGARKVTLAALCLADSFGVAHAPFAQARALLNEHGMGAAVVLYTDVESGALASTSARELVPPIPSADGHSGLLDFCEDGLQEHVEAVPTASC